MFVMRNIDRINIGCWLWSSHRLQFAACIPRSASCITRISRLCWEFVRARRAHEQGPRLAEIMLRIYVRSNDSRNRLPHGFPLRRGFLQLRMTDEQVPNDRAHAFRVRRDA